METRIGTIRHKLAGATPEQHMDKLGRLNDLERRHKQLEEQPQALNREGPGFSQEVRATLILLADELVGAADELILSVEEHYQADQRKSAEKR